MKFRCFLGHNWDILDVSYAEYANFGKGDVTVILKKCNKCNKIDTKVLNGFFERSKIMNNPIKGELK